MNQSNFEHPRVIHFLSGEFRCKCGCNSDVIIDIDLLLCLEELRYKAGGKSIRIVSGYRCQEYNRRVGGVKKSQHLLGRAADIWTPTRGRRKRVYEAALTIDLFRTGGIGVYEKFIHLDIRGKYAQRRARWGLTRL